LKSTILRFLTVVNTLSEESVRNKFRFSIRTVPRINFTKNGNRVKEFTFPAKEGKFLQILSRKTRGSDLEDVREVFILKNGC
jgi:hypothetical protein